MKLQSATGWSLFACALNWIRWVLELSLMQITRLLKLPSGNIIMYHAEATYKKKIKIYILHKTQLMSK